MANGRRFYDLPPDVTTAAGDPLAVLAGLFGGDPLDPRGEAAAFALPPAAPTALPPAVSPAAPPATTAAPPGEAEAYRVPTGPQLFGTTGVPGRDERLRAILAQMGAGGTTGAGLAVGGAELPPGGPSELAGPAGRIFGQPRFAPREEMREGRRIFTGGAPVEARPISPQEDATMDARARIGALQEARDAAVQSGDFNRARVAESQLNEARQQFTAAQQAAEAPTAREKFSLELLKQQVEVEKARLTGPEAQRAAAIGGLDKQLLANAGSENVARINALAKLAEGRDAMLSDLLKVFQNPAALMMLGEDAGPLLRLLSQAAEKRLTQRGGEAAPPKPGEQAPGAGGLTAEQRAEAIRKGAKPGQKIMSGGKVIGTL